MDFAAEPMTGNDSISVKMAPGSEVDNCKGGMRDRVGIAIYTGQTIATPIPHHSA